jgi:hypothetical protein
MLLQIILAMQFELALAQKDQALGPQLKACFAIPESSSAGRKACFSQLGFVVPGCEIEKKAVKVCGVTLPPTDGLVVGLEYDNCWSMVDGALTIGHLPLNLFPIPKKSPELGDSQLKLNLKKPSVACSPKAAKASRAGALFIRAEDKTKRNPLPKLDWQDCDCEVYESDGRSN